MIDFYLLFDGVNNNNYMNHMKYYFRNFNFKIIKNEELLNTKGNILIIKKELYPVPSFDVMISNIIIEMKSYYLSKCKNIHYITMDDITIENNSISIKKIENSALLFITPIFCPIRNEKYKVIFDEMLPMYIESKKNINFLYNKQYAMKHIKQFIANEYELPFFNIIIFLNKKNCYDVLNKIENVKYKYCRYTIFMQNIGYENTEYCDMKIKSLSKTHIINAIPTKKNNVILHVLNNIILCFENLVFFKNQYNFDFFDKCNDILKHYKIYITSKLICIPSFAFVQLPIHYNVKEYMQDISLYKFILLNISQCGNSLYNTSKITESYLKLSHIPPNYNIIEQNLLVIKEYDILLNVINNHMKNIPNSTEYYHTMVKKITIAILAERENLLNEELVNIVKYIEDKKYLLEVYMFISNSKFTNVKEELTVKLLSKFEDDNKIYMFLFDKCIQTSNNASNLNIFFDSIIKNVDMIKEKIKDNNQLILNLINQLSRHTDDNNLIDKFNVVLSVLSDIVDIRNFNNLFALLEKTNIRKEVYINFLLLLATKFNPYYKKYDDFITIRQNIKNNLLSIKDKIKLTLELNNILMFNVGNFHLSYQGVPSVEIFKLKTEINRNLCPELNYKIDTNFKNPKIKILFHAQHLHRVHSVYKDRHQVIKALSEDSRFDVYFSTFDDLMAEVMFTFGNAKHIKLQQNLVSIKNTLVALKLDIIVYCEIGMHPISYYMAHMKLAKIQCNTWGHSDTSGIDTIDYYFSSKLYELPYEEAQTHYSEKLILQNGLCTSYVNPLSKHLTTPFKTRMHFGFTDDVVIYFCAQSLFKINPLFDDYIVQILSNVPNSVIVLSDGGEKHKILERINNMNIGHQIKFFPGANHYGYMNLMNISDVILDVYPFGGCNSSFEGFSLGKVIVTQPSIMINGRFTSGFYKRMNLDNLICSNKRKYIDFAIKLGTNKKYREKIENQIKEKKDCLFCDQETLQEWKDDMIKIYNNFQSIEYKEL